MKPIPIYDETATISCTLQPHEVPGRIATVERMRATLDGVERTDDGLLLHFPTRADIEADLRQFVIDEKRCCQFWGFEVVAGDERLTLRWDGPPSARELVDRLEEFFTGDGPADFLAGLL